MITTTDIFGSKHLVSSDDLQWRPSVYGVVVKDSNILLSPQFGKKYDLPGGGADIHEKLEEAVVREVKEETGINVKVEKLLGVEQNFFTSSHDKAESKHYNSILFYYKCSYVSGELSDEGLDEEEVHYAKMAEWVPSEKLDSIEVASTVDYKKFIRMVMI